MGLIAKPVSFSQVSTTQLVLNSDINAFGTLFGGILMSWIDICGAISAQRHAEGPVVTASVDDLHFIAPVYLGWVVNLKASVNFVSRTSMEVGVRVDAENPLDRKVYHTSTAYLTFVALDSSGKPKPLPPLLLETEDEKRRHQEAIQRRSLRLQRRALKKAQAP
jgi:acyl-CoA hydrolase